MRRLCFVRSKLLLRKRRLYCLWKSDGNHILDHQWSGCICRVWMRTPNADSNTERIFNEDIQKLPKEKEIQKVTISRENSREGKQTQNKM